MVRYMHEEKFFAEHRAEDIILIEDIVREHRPEILIELGTYKGGLAAMFADVVRPWHGAVHTFDVERQFDEGILEKSNIIFHQEDVLTLNDRIVRLLRHNRCILYCDNGHKETEIATYAPHVRPGSLLGCHDYDSEVRSSWVEPFMVEAGFVQHRHADFEALTTPTYPISMTRFWKR